MVPAFIATFLFSLSIIAAGRSTRLLGSTAANFWRMVVASVLLGAWAYSVGLGLGGGAFGVFFLSGCVGYGVGDFGLFQTLPRLGPRLSTLMINCLGAPLAALIEWLWLGTRLTFGQSLCGVVILVGVAISLAPERHIAIPRRRRLSGVAFGVMAAVGQAYGAVLTRKAYEIAHAAGYQVDGGTAAFQRILGGIVVGGLPYLWLVIRARVRAADQSLPVPRRGGKRAWPWVLLNGIAGPAAGVAFFQWALKSTPSGLVLAITAMTPLLVVPLAYRFEGDRPGMRSLVGGLVAVGGVIGLTLVR